jgi:hypothetical protein
MIHRAASYYIGLWAPIAACWVVVVLVYAAFRDVAVGIGLAVALLGPLAGILSAVLMSRADKKSSIHVIAASVQISSSEWLRRGFKKGLIAGPASVVGVAVLAALPVVLDRLLTSLGK